MTDQVISNSRVLVTGAAGFIGSNLVEDLLKQDNDVVGIDNFETGKRENLGEFMAHPSFQFCETDILDFEGCKKACDGIDYVLHQAALGSVPRSIENPIRTNNTNVSGFLNMLVAAKDAKVKRFVYATSSSVYGTEKRLPKVEAKIGQPLSPYAVTKAVNEQYANVFYELYGLETIGLRYFNVFGKRQDPNGAYAAAIPKFIGQFIKHEAPVVHGDGTQSRDFTHIANVIQANHKAALSTNPDSIGEVFNVACGYSTNLNELLEILQVSLSEFDPKIAEIKIVHGKERIGDVRHSLASIVKSKTMLGYRPVFDLKQGLDNAISWYWENLQ